MLHLILHNNRTMKNASDIRRHDSAVCKKWQALLDSSNPLSNSLRATVEELVGNATQSDLHLGAITAVSVLLLLLVSVL